MIILPLPPADEKLLSLAVAVATEAHKGQYRKPGNVPYITHPEAVANATPSLHGKIIGWLHDVMEMNPAYPEARMREIFPSWVVDHLLLLTRKQDEPYDIYIFRAASNPLTKQVKLADLKHNLSDLKAGTLRDKYRLTVWLLGASPD